VISQQVVGVAADSAEVAADNLLVQTVSEAVVVVVALAHLD
jgi:hypothetical protein